MALADRMEQDESEEVVMMEQTKMVFRSSNVEMEDSSEKTRKDQTSLGVGLVPQ